MAARQICTWVISVSICLATASDESKVINVGVIVPFNGRYLWVINKTRPALEVALKVLNGESRLREDHTIRLLFRDSKCSPVDAHIAAADLHNEQHVHVFIGPVCTQTVGHVALYTERWGVPIISPSTLVGSFHDTSEFPLLTRVMGSYDKVGDFVLKILKRFGWKNVAMVYSDVRAVVHDRRTECYFKTKAVQDAVRRVHAAQIPVFTFDCEDSGADYETLLKDLANKARIVFMCTCPNSLREIMIKAHELNYDNGEFVFINLNLFATNKNTVRPWYSANDTLERNTKANKGFAALMTITIHKTQTPEFRSFSDRVRKAARQLYKNYIYGEVNIFVSAIHEALFLFAIAVNETIAIGGSLRDGAAITRRMWNRTFVGVTGTVYIDEFGDRNPDYSLLDMDPSTSLFQVVANYFGHKKEYEPVIGTTIDWAGGRRTPPPDYPKCGYDGSLCPPEELIPAYGIAFLVIGTIMLICIAALCWIKRYKDHLLRTCLMANVNHMDGRRISLLNSIYHNMYMYTPYREVKIGAELAQMTWEINWSDISFGPRDMTMQHERHYSRRCSVVSSGSVDSLTGHLDHNIPTYTQVGSYKGTLVSIKPFHRPGLIISRPLLLDVKRVKDLQNDHVVRFIGICTETPNQCILTEYCKKGSLQDVLESEDILLDWMFRYSIMMDVVRGMIYLHNSEIKSHGRLKSTNCVVDSRFVVKITDFGMHQVRDSTENMDHESFAYHSSKLWSAPELLRMSRRPPQGTQKGDVYSFGVICQEIVYRNGVFYLAGEDLSPYDIVRKVSKRLGKPFRPTLEEEDMPCVGLLYVIHNCWEEDPMDRPDFNTVKSIIKRLNKDGNKGNILDNLLSRMEQYANNLETLVADRTEDFLEQKKRAEDLLCSMLPKSVADQLVRGETVTAETFESVTIFFSDICGFTEMSAESTPMQIVDFLNDLYTLFDSTIENFDVYKVETIGDAYMVVSGMPDKNGNLHVREIARLSLTLLDRIKKFRIRHRPNDKLRIRIGLHTGGVCAGVVGLKMPRYCLFGDTVNTASRMESAGAPLKVHISSATKEGLDEFGTFHVSLRGTVDVKGKGPMTTFWLMGEFGWRPPIV